MGVTAVTPVAAAVPSAAPVPAGPTSDVLKAPRPAEGEYLGLYLMGKKVGYMFQKTGRSAANPQQVEQVTEVMFRAGVGDRVSQRYQKETKTYEAKPGGRMIKFVSEKKGDGGDERLEATETPTGVRVLRSRPGQPNEVLTVKPSKETVEDADQARVALLRGTEVQGWVTDATDLETYKLSSTVGPKSTRMMGGVEVKVAQVTTVSDKEKVPAEAWVDDKGRMLEIDFGATMKAIAEPKEKAQRLDQVEVFGLTRVVLPKMPPATVKGIPSTMKLVVKGFPEKYRKPSARQRYTALSDERVEVTITATAPKATGVTLPVADPNDGANVKSTLAIEAANADIQATAKEIVRGEKEAWAAARKINAWVNAKLVKEYGASADRSTDVLRQKKGDCTEHSLLSVALLRAVGIPSKRVDGVVFLVNEDKVPALYWHEWVEVYVGEWVAMDPTFNQEVADATHFALGEDGNAEITPLIGSLKVVDVK
ncbi:MAG: transglutaminase-like domain-containing protein [Myxococcaceae bacterium]|nr:transglutaminase-like domain-containing protein [Myxococcaceae bacterium]